MNKEVLRKFMIVFGFAMVAIYVVLGLALLFFPVYKYIPDQIRTIFGIFFLAYGFFRLIRSIQKFKEYRNE